MPCPGGRLEVRVMQGAARSGREARTGAVARDASTGQLVSAAGPSMRMVARAGSGPPDCRQLCAIRKTVPSCGTMRARHSPALELPRPRGAAEVRRRVPGRRPEPKRMRSSFVEASDASSFSDRGGPCPFVRPGRRPWRAKPRTGWAGARSGSPASPCRSRGRRARAYGAASLLKTVRNAGYILAATARPAP